MVSFVILYFTPESPHAHARNVSFKSILIFARFVFNVINGDKERLVEERNVSPYQ